MSAFTELLERHIPYASQHRDGLLCLLCLDITHEPARRCGEYATAGHWALHVERELRAAGLTVTRRKPAPEPEQEAML